MPLKLIRDDILHIAPRVDAVIDPTDSYYSGGGGLDAQIHRAAGADLVAVCNMLPFLECGQANATPGFGTGTRYIFHTVGPVWHGGLYGEEQQLISCYRECLRLAVKYACASVAFPLISSGTFGYPKDKVLRVAMNAITDFLADEYDELMVYLVIFDKRSYELSSSLIEGIEERITDEYVDARLPWNEAVRERNMLREMRHPASGAYTEELREEIRFGGAGPYAYDMAEMAAPPKMMLPVEEKCAMAPAAVPKHSKKPRKVTEGDKEKIDKLLMQQDEGFSDMLIRLIEDRQIKDSEAYHRANVSKSVFGKIINNKNYKAGKQIVLAFAAGLQLSMDETTELMHKAGHAFTNKCFDVVVHYCIEQGIYDVSEINSILFKYDQMLLGSGFKE